MKWFRGRRSDSIEGTTSETGAVEEELRHSSLALNALCHRLRSGRKYNVLDLGPACGTNVEFFSNFSGKIYIEDLHRTLNSFDFLSPDDGLSFDSVFRYLLPYQRTTRFDLIFSWDLFNYLEKREFLFLMRHLGRFCTDETLIFALISTNKSIPEQPSSFRILDHETLASRTHRGILRECPRYEESELLQLMPGFRVCQSFLLRSGVKEYLFLRDRERLYQRRA